MRHYSGEHRDEESSEKGVTLSHRTRQRSAFCVMLSANPALHHPPTATPKIFSSTNQIF
jgi:hypothetical protein